MTLDQLQVGDVFHNGEESVGYAGCDPAVNEVYLFWPGNRRHATIDDPAARIYSLCARATHWTYVEGPSLTPPPPRYD